MAATNPGQRVRCVSPKLSKQKDDSAETESVSKGSEAAQRRRQLAAQLLQQIPDKPATRAKHAERWQIQELLAAAGIPSP